MLQISQDHSQWHTVGNLVSFLNDKQLEIIPYIVDIGAANGKLNSNSWDLITVDGWAGLLVEPNPTAFHEMVFLYEENGYDPEEVAFENSAIANYTGQTILYLPLNEKDEQLASLQIKHPKKVSVNCITVNDLLEKHYVGDVGILSVDTEGFDLSVLKMWMETDNRPQIIITESWPHLPYDNMEKKSLLSANGYGKVLHFGENEIFIKKDVYDSKH